MAGVEAKIMQNPSLKTYKCSLGCQICLRLLASVASLAAVWIMFTSNQSLVLYGIHIDAKYSDSSAFKFFAVANLIACSFSVNSLFVAVILARKCSNPNKYFYLFLHDLIVMTLVMAACAAATAIGVVARNGNVHTGWIAICDNFVRFCHRLTISVTFSYVALVLYLFLTIISAKKFRKSPLDEENGGGGGGGSGDEMSNF